ncbi:retinol dehydrogenase 11-like [Rhynchophorus ferrugineus]|uniref:Uncharacterized protein n=1 Tax=Rhynchophorus ferrugineus TaxID=354439 RepID=A0A834HKD1_RHYFE|nr:hypothetical protein GWI33_003943 [Rhynchophorus ferrugineus]
MFYMFLNDFIAFSNSWWPYIISFCIVSIYAIRLYTGGVPYTNNKRIDGKTVIITGSTNGIGFETAKNICARGGSVILAIRDMEKAKIAIQRIKKDHEKALVIAKLLDLTDFSSIQKFANEIALEYDKVDVLINNAAIIFQPFQKTMKGNEMTIVTNFLGPFLLTHLLLSCLNKSEQGRIINVSAMAHFSGKLYLENLNMEKHYNEMDAFAQSKLALTIFTKYLASLLIKTKITCNSVCPGMVRGTGYLNYSPLQKTIWSKLYWPWMWLFLKTPEEGCQSIVYLAVEPQLNDVSGYYFSEFDITEPSEQVKDVRLAEALYERSCSIVDIKGREIIDSLEQANDTETNDVSQEHHNGDF